MDYHHHARLTIYSREQLAKRVLQAGGRRLMNLERVPHASRFFAKRAGFDFLLS